MVITNALIDKIEQKAKCCERLRSNICLHQSSLDKVQQMVNVLIPGTKMPIHRHLNTSESLILLRGTINIVYFDEYGNETKRIILSKESDQAIVIPKGQWHNIEVKEPVALMEVKEGPYQPLTHEEIL